jgi:hypothetical protein
MTARDFRSPFGSLTPRNRGHFTSLWSVCLRQRLQNFENSNRSVVVLRFFVVE